MLLICFKTFRWPSKIQIIQSTKTLFYKPNCKWFVLEAFVESGEEGGPEFEIDPYQEITFNAGYGMRTTLQSVVDAGLLSRLEVNKILRNEIFLRNNYVIIFLGRRADQWCYLVSRNWRRFTQVVVFGNKCYCWRLYSRWRLCFDHCRSC